MSNNTTRFAVAPGHHFKRKAGLLLTTAALAVGTLGASFNASAAERINNFSDANARYQSERAVCMTGQSNQDRATCLKEAGAALKEAKMGRLSSDQSAFKQNALLRCNALPADERVACQRRIEGDGTTTGSVRDGGLLRELVVPDTK